MNPKEDDRRRWKRKKRECSGQILNSQREKTRHECVKMLTEQSKKRGITSERVQSGESDMAGETDIQGGLSCPLRLFTSLPLSLLGRLTLPFIRLTGHRRGG